MKRNWFPITNWHLITKTGRSRHLPMQRLPMWCLLPVPVSASTRMTRRRFQGHLTTTAAGIKTRSPATSGTSDNKPSARLRSSAPTPLSPAPPLAPGAQPELSPGRIDKSVLAIAEPKRLRDKAHLGFVASQPCLVCGRQPIRPASSALCATPSARSQSERRVHRPTLPRSSPPIAPGRQ